MTTTQGAGPTVASLRDEVMALQKENASLKRTVASLAAEKRMVEVARDVATRSALIVWPRRPQDP